jgi:hypothetical protein
LHAASTRIDVTCTEAALTRSRRLPGEGSIADS